MQCGMIFAKSNFMRMHLAKLLVREGLVNVDQIREAIERQRELKCGLYESLCDLGFISESDLVEFLGNQYGVPVMDIDDHEIDRDVIALIPDETAREKYLIPVEVSGSNLTVAMCDPSNILLLDDLSFLTGRNIKPVVASERSIKAKLAEYYGSNEADSDRPTEESSGTSGPEHLSAVLSMSDEDRRPIDEIISELERYRDSHISQSERTGDEKQSYGVQKADGSTHRKEHEHVFDKPILSGTESGTTDNEFDLEHHSRENTGQALSHHKPREDSVNRTEDAYGASSLHEHKPSPLFKPDSETEEQLIVTEKAVADFDKPMHGKGAERVIGFDYNSGEDLNTLNINEYQSELGSVSKKDGNEWPHSSEVVVPGSRTEKQSDSTASPDEGKADNSLIEYDLSESENFSSAKKEGEENKDNTSLTGLNPSQAEGALRVPDGLASTIKVEKGNEDSPEDRNLQNRAHDSNPSLHPEKEVNDVLSKSIDSGYEESGILAPGLDADSFETEAEKAESAYFTNEEKEPYTEVSGFLNTDNLQPEETGWERQSFSKADEDSQKEINADKTEPQSATGHEDGNLSLEEEQSVTKSSESIHEASGKKPRSSVLVVDDSPTVQKIVSIALKRKEYTVYTAGDGMKALSTLNEVIPDLILVDVNMPHMDGYQLCKIIRNHGLTKNIPVVIMTGKTRILEKMKWKRAGASGYIVKPFDYSSLVEIAERYLN